MKIADICGSINNERWPGVENLPHYRDFSRDINQRDKNLSKIVKERCPNI